MILSICCIVSYSSYTILYGIYWLFHVLYPHQYCVCAYLSACVCLGDYRHMLPVYGVLEAESKSACMQNNHFTNGTTSPHFFLFSSSYDILIEGVIKWIRTSLHM